MKLTLRIICMALVMTLHVACKSDGENHNENNESNEVKTKIDLGNIAYEDSGTTDILEDYLRLKDALVNSNLILSKKAAKELSMNFTDEPRNALKSFSVQIENSNDLEEHRKLFSDLSAHIQKVFRFRMTSGRLYKQYCPMAFDNKGAFWFSNIEEIRNPYFGDKMLKCGKVTDTIQNKM